MSSIQPSANNEMTTLRHVIVMKKDMLIKIRVLKVLRVTVVAVVSTLLLGVSISSSARSLSFGKGGGGGGGGLVRNSVLQPQFATAFRTIQYYCKNNHINNYYRNFHRSNYQRQRQRQHLDLDLHLHRGVHENTNKNVIIEQPKHIRQQILWHRQRQRKEQYSPNHASLSSLSLSTPISASEYESATINYPIVQRQQSEEEKQKLKPQLRERKIAIIGSGAVGCYYGGRIWDAGRNDSSNVDDSSNGTIVLNDVRFYIRNSTDYNTARINGLTISSDVKSNIYIPPNLLKVCNTISDMGGPIFDWIIISVKSTSLHAIPELVVPLLKPDNTTRILVIMNGFIENDLIQYIKQYIGEDLQYNHSERQQNQHEHQYYPQLQCCKALYGGMALICSNRIGPAHIHHSYFGQLTIGVASTRRSSKNVNIDVNIDDDQVAVEQLFGKNCNHQQQHLVGPKINSDVADNTASMCIEAIKEFIPEVDVDIVYEPFLIRGRWKKMVWNLPFNGISVAMGGITVDQIVTDPGLRQLAYNIMNETITIANIHLQSLYNTTSDHENNNDPNVNSRRKNLPKLLDYTTDCEPMMKLSDDMGVYRTSTMLDLINKRSMEVQYMFTKPIEIARLYNVSTPYLDTIVSFIQAYQRMYNLY